MAMKKPVKKAAKPKRTDSDRAYAAAADSKYSNSPSASTRKNTALKRSIKEDNDAYKAETLRLVKKYATPYRGNKITGFGYTAKRKTPLRGKKY